MPLRAPKRAAFAIVVGGFLIVLGACGQAATQVGTTGHQAESAAGSVTRPEVAGGSPTLQAIVNKVLAGMGNSDRVESVSISGPPPGTGVDADSSWLSFVLPAGTQTGSDWATPTWQAMVVAGAVRDQAASSGITVTGYSIAYQNTDGSTPDLTGGDSMILGVPDHSPSQVDSSTISSTVQKNAPSLGLKVESVSFVTPDDPAPVVIAQTDDPKGFLASGASPAKLLGGTDGYEGFYIEVDDMQGAPVVIDAGSLRAAEGLHWIRPDLDSGDGVTPTGDALTAPSG